MESALEYRENNSNRSISIETNTRSAAFTEYFVKNGLGARVIQPHCTAYKEREESYWSNTAKIEPVCIIRPTCSDEVSRIIQLLVARSEQFAVRSGGHMHCIGSNNIRRGVTIDLSLLDFVKYDSVSKTVHVGPGALWSQVYTELQKHQQVVNGGREGHVGVAGLLLGGGFTYFTGRRGFACDDIVAFEVALANGLVIVADQGNHADLFKALKGGSNNFGIVTRFSLRTFKCDRIWGGMLFYSMDLISDILVALSSFTENIHNDVDSNILCFITYTPDYKDVVVATGLVQVAAVANAPSYETWLNLSPSMSTCKMTNLSEITTEYTVAPKGSYNTMFTLCFKNDIRITTEAVRLHGELVDSLNQFVPDGNFTTQCLLQPLPMIFGQRSAAVGGNVMGVENQTHDGILFVAIAMVGTATQYTFAYQRTKAWVDAVWQYAGTIENGQLDWVYLNYADSSQSPLESYGPANVEHLKLVSTKYDPNRVWQRLCPGGFKISNIGT